MAQVRFRRVITCTEIHVTVNRTHREGFQPVRPLTPGVRMQGGRGGHGRLAMVGGSDGGWE